MNVPPSLLPLVDDGIIEEVLRPLMSGKEAQVYLVVAGGIERVAKVYKDAQHRSFKHRADYTEGRRTRNSRDQRAVARRTKHGRSQDEAAWRSTEVDMIYRLRAAGVRVPEPYIFSDGVLVMEFITDADGFAAPRLGDADLSRDEAVVVFEALVQEVIRMLCAGVVHGDLSDFNVLLGERGPVVIDFPQAMDAASNRNARNILIRDVDNLHNFLARCSRDYRPKPFAQEMWALFERGELLPDTKLRGLYRPDSKAADVGGLLREIGDARRDAVRAGLVDDEIDPSDDVAPASAAPAGGPPRRRVEVVMGRAAAGPQKPPQGQRSGAGRPPSHAGQAGQASQARSAGPGVNERTRDACSGANGRAGNPMDSAARPRPAGGPRRGVSLADAEALLAAQPALTDAQREKAAAIAKAAREAQAARAARAQSPRGQVNGGRPDPRAPSKNGQAAQGRQPSPQAGSASGDGKSGGGKSEDGKSGGGRRRRDRSGRDRSGQGAPVQGAPVQGPPENGTQKAAPRAERPVQDATEGAGVPAKRRRRRRRGRSGGASSEPST